MQLKRIQIELTARCNEHCIHCYVPQHSGNSDMDSDLLESIIDQCKQMGVEQITFSGGEPMLHPDFFKVLDRSNWKDLKIRIFSNLFMLNANILAALKTWHIHEVQTSLYSVYPEIHDAVTRTPGSCEKTKQGIKELLEHGIPVFISCPITTINSHSYPDVLAFAKSMGIRAAPDNMIFAQPGGSRQNLQYRLNTEEALQVIQDVLNNDTAYDALRYAPGYRNLAEALPCVQDICKHAICVNFRGEVLPQPEWYRVLGDLNSQTLKDIWENSPEIKKLRKISLKDFPGCLVCQDIEFCGMDLGANANENDAKNPFIIPKHICELANATRNLVHSHRNKQQENSMTLYRQKFDTFIRRYAGADGETIGYITSKSDFGDRVVDAVGAAFLCALSRTEQSLDALAEKIAQSFVGADIETLKKDAAEFYAMLEDDGFVVSGASAQELDKKDTRFSYAAIDPKTVRVDFTPAVRRADKTTQEFLEEHFKGRPYLTSFQIELTSRCNERCIHCYIPHETKLDDIEPALFYDTLDQCREMGLLNITLSGGEPLLHPQFLQFLRKAKEYDFSINILSNLTLLDDEIVAEMKANRLSSVQVSLYSMKAEIHDAITQAPGSFEKTKNAILKLIENDIPLQISCPVMKQNKNCYVDVMKWAHEHKCRAVSDYIMMACFDGATGNLDNRLSVDETEKLIRDIIENDPDYQNEIATADIAATDAQDISEDIACGVCIDTMCMVSNGNTYPCAGWQSYVCGNIKETPLREIWENSPQVKHLRSIRKKHFPMCINCPDKNFCAMCMVRNGNEDPNGDYMKINEHFCKVAALNRKVVEDWKAGI